MLSVWWSIEISAEVVNTHVHMHVAIAECVSHTVGHWCDNNLMAIETFIIAVSH